jgi:hypothetical protein
MYRSSGNFPAPELIKAGPGLDPILVSFRFEKPSLARGKIPCAFYSNKEIGAASPQPDLGRKDQRKVLSVLANQARSRRFVYSLEFEMA